MKPISLIAGAAFLALAIRVTAADAPGATNQRGGGNAQPPAVSPATPAVTDLVRGRGGDDGRDEAKGLALRGNVAAAESALSVRSKFAPRTGDWHFETGTKLVHLAADVAREGKGPAARALTDAALQHLGQVAALAPNDREKARAKAMEAHIHEKYRGDPVTALATYGAALKLDPENTAVKEAHAFLKEADARLRARIKPAKK